MKLAFRASHVSVQNSLGSRRTLRRLMRGGDETRLLPRRLLLIIFQISFRGSLDLDHYSSQCHSFFIIFVFSFSIWSNAKKAKNRRGKCRRAVPRQPVDLFTRRFCSKKWTLRSGFIFISFFVCILNFFPFFCFFSSIIHTDVQSPGAFNRSRPCTLISQLSILDHVDFEKNHYMLFSWFLACSLPSPRTNWRLSHLVVYLIVAESAVTFIIIDIAIRYSQI